MPDAAPGNSTISAPIELFSSMSFLVFYWRYAVHLYRERIPEQNYGFDVLLSHQAPKILVSQMLAVWIFNFVALVLTKLLLYGVVLLGSQFRYLRSRWTMI